MVRLLKRLKPSPLRRVQAFPMYGALGRSAPSLHRESTDSLIHAQVHCVLPVGVVHCLDLPNDINSDSEDGQETR